jgi:hypothetical protein
MTLPAKPSRKHADFRMISKGVVLPSAPTPSTYRGTVLALLVFSLLSSIAVAVDRTTTLKKTQPILPECATDILAAFGDKARLSAGVTHTMNKTYDE